MLPVISAFHLPAALLPLVVLWIVPLWLVNRVTVTMMNRPAPLTPGFRIALSLLVALFISYAALLWFFNDDIEAAQAVAEPEKWIAKTHDLQDERNGQVAIRDLRPPIVQQDPDVVEVQQELDGKIVELREAERLVLCEEDGSCGTRIRGRDREYWSKVEYRDRVKREVTALSAQLTSVKAEVRARISQFAKDRETAKERIAEIDEALRMRGSNPPAQPGTIGAVLKVAQEKSTPAVWVSTVPFVVFLIVDWLALLMVVRRICQGDASITDEFNRQREREERIPPDAQHPLDLPERMLKKLFPKLHEKYFPQEAGE